MNSQEPEKNELIGEEEETFSISSAFSLNSPEPGTPRCHSTNKEECIIALQLQVDELSKTVKEKEETIDFQNRKMKIIKDSVSKKITEEIETKTQYKIKEMERKIDQDQYLIEELTEKKKDMIIKLRAANSKLQMNEAYMAEMKMKEKDNQEKLEICLLEINKLKSQVNYIKTKQQEENVKMRVFKENILEYIEHIRNNITYEEEEIEHMSNDLVQKLVRDNKELKEAKEKVFEMKSEFRMEFAALNHLLDPELCNQSMDLLKKLDSTIKRINETEKLLKMEAYHRKISLSKPDNMEFISSFYEQPNFKGSLNEQRNIYGFLDAFDSYFNNLTIPEEERSTVLLKCLLGRAKTVAKKGFPNNAKPPLDELKSLLIKHFGNRLSILEDLKSKHIQIGKIPELFENPMSEVYVKSSKHLSLIMETERLVKEKEGPFLPPEYIHLMEEFLPRRYWEKFVTYELTADQEERRLDPEEKLEIIREILEEIQKISILKNNQPINSSHL